MKKTIAMIPGETGSLPEEVQMVAEMITSGNGFLPSWTGDEQIPKLFFFGNGQKLQEALGLQKMANSKVSIWEQLSLKWYTEVWTALLNVMSAQVNSFWDRVLSLGSSISLNRSRAFFSFCTAALSQIASADVPLSSKIRNEHSQPGQHLNE